MRDGGTRRGVIQGYVGHGPGGLAEALSDFQNALHGLLEYIDAYGTAKRLDPGQQGRGRGRGRTLPAWMSKS